MKIQKFEGMIGPCGIFDDSLGMTNDEVPVSLENNVYSDAMNLDGCNYTALLLDSLDLNLLRPNLRSYIRNAILNKAQTSFVYGELLRPFNKACKELGIECNPHITPDGIFINMEDYFTWQKLYFHHPTKSEKRA